MDVESHNLCQVRNFNEEPFYMIDRDVGERERDRWNCLYDLASFEMQKTPAVDEKSKMNSMKKSPPATMR